MTGFNVNTDGKICQPFLMTTINKLVHVKRFTHIAAVLGLILKKMHIRGFEVQWTRSDINKGGVVEGCCGGGAPSGLGAIFALFQLVAVSFIVWPPLSGWDRPQLSVGDWGNCHITQLKCPCDLAVSGSLLPSLLLLAQMSSPCTIRNGTTTNKWNGCRVRVKQMSDRCVHIALTTGLFSLWGHCNVVMITLWHL